jgi:hypothetical protein
VIEIVPATLEHARAIDLRDADAREIAAHGLSKEAGLSFSLDRALWADAYLVDGKVAALLGCGTTSLLGGHATPWLITGKPVERVRKSFARLAREKIAELRERYPLMINYVHADYADALKFMAWLGFTIDPPRPWGPLKAPFCRIHMRGPDGH